MAYEELQRMVMSLNTLTVLRTFPEDARQMERKVVEFADLRGQRRRSSPPQVLRWTPAGGMIDVRSGKLVTIQPPPPPPPPPPAEGEGARKPEPPPEPQEILSLEQALNYIIELPHECVCIWPNAHLLLMQGNLPHADNIITVAEGLDQINDQRKSIVFLVSQEAQIPSEILSLGQEVEVGPITKEEAKKAIGRWRADLPRVKVPASVVDVLERMSRGMSREFFNQVLTELVLVEGVVLPSGRVSERQAVKAIQAIKRRRAMSGGLLEPVAPGKYHDLAGWDEATRTMKRYASKGGFSDRQSPARLFMVAILGVTGMGKTHWVKMLPRILGHNLQALEVNAASIMGTGGDAGLVGSVERAWQRLITQSRLADGCIVLFDEAEKMWGGVQSSAKTEGGAFLRGHSLWLKEIEMARIDPANSPMVFWFATLNSTENLRPEDLSRADQIWYVGLPSHSTRRGIIEIHAQNLENRYPGIFADNVTYDWMAELCEGRTGRAMKQIVARAYVEADDLITREAFERAVHGVTSIDTLFKDEIGRQARLWGAVLPHVDRDVFATGDEIAVPLQIEETSRGLVTRRGHGVKQSFQTEQEVDDWLTRQYQKTQQQRLRQ